MPEQLVALVVQVLRERRESTSLSKRQLAARAGVSRTAIILMESGKRFPSLELVVKLAISMELPLSAVIAEAEGRLANGLRKKRPRSRD